jgi:hypothetical protein
MDVSSVMEKTAQIQAKQKRHKKPLAPAAGFCKSGIATSLLLQSPFF